MTNTKTLKELAQLVRWLVLSSTTRAGSGHPSSCLSAVEVMVGLMFGGTFRANLNKPGDPDNDRLIFSKGHAAPLLYALYAAAGKASVPDLQRLRTIGSPLQGHPMMDFRYTEAPTGSLGQGLSIGAGEALAAKMDGRVYRTYVLLGDGEMAEGNVWEAVQFAAFHKLDNLVGILDVNRLGQSGPTMTQWQTGLFAKRLQSFGWKTIVIKGHDMASVVKVFVAAGKTKRQPTMIIAKTVKGKGIAALENKEGWHGKVLSPEALARAKKELEPMNIRIRGSVSAPKKTALLPGGGKPVVDPHYSRGVMVSPRQAAGHALVRLAPAYPQIVVLDGDVKNSTQTEKFEAKFPARFIEGYIAEQNLVGVANGLALRGKIPVAATFAAFFTRAFDQLRMLQYAGAHTMFLGTHPGVHIGEDGASQMGLEDIALFRSVQATVLYPADALATERLLDLGLRAKGMVYLRLTRATLPVLYSTSAPFRVGGSTVLRSSDGDVLTIVAAGVTLHEALAAAETLAKRKISARVIDAYSVAPIDAATLRRAARETKHVIVVEDHRAAGGLADAVRIALGKESGAVVSLAVHGIPHSGTPAQLLKEHAIDASSIVRTALALKP